MSEYPDISRGTQWSSIPARQWQNGFRDLRRLMGMTVGPGLRLDKGFTNYRITRTKQGVSGGIGGAGLIRLAKVAAFAEPPALDILFVNYRMSNGEFDAETSPAFVWPGTTQDDFRTFLGTTIVVPVVLVDGVAYVMQLPRWWMITPPSGTPIGDCAF